MKRIGLPLLILLLLTGRLFASPADSALPHEAQSLLWKISGKGLKQPSFLFGTMHLICPADYLWTNAMQQAFKKCKAVCFEMDMDDPQVMMDIALGMMNTSGKTLKDYFTEADYALLVQYLKDSVDVDASLFQQLKPAALLSLFAIPGVQCKEPISYETKLQEMAKKNAKEIIGLEEAKEQIALLDAIPEDTIAAEIISTIITRKKQDEPDYQTLIAAYKNQNTEALFELIETAEKTGTDLDAFLDERNKNWIPRMEDIVEQRPVFFAVGAGHLWGQNGLIYLLRKTGYTVTAVR